MVTIIFGEFKGKRGTIIRHNADLDQTLVDVVGIGYVWIDMDWLEEIKTGEQ